MEFSKPLLKIISIFLTVLFLLQSCKVYDSKTITIEQAIQRESKVKLKLNDNEPYYFNKLVMENNKLFGFSSFTNSTTEYLDILGFEIIKDGKYSKILLQENLIKEIHQHNKTTSIIVTILTGIIVIGSLIYIGFRNMSVGGLY